MRTMTLAAAVALLLAGLVLSGNTQCQPLPVEPDGCEYGGEYYEPGESFPSEDGCNTCSCGGGGAIACTLRACGCVYGGQWYEYGDTFMADDGCNTCTCSDGGVACTEMACLPDDCDPDAEWWRDYVGESPEICAVIRFICPDNTEYFANDCGCGCEQSPNCPQWFNCMPSPNTPGCDVDRIQADCPYSMIAW